MIETCDVGGRTSQIVEETSVSKSPLGMTK
jgi:hypothetical protein